jgi:hypothetical protein
MEMAQGQSLMPLVRDEPGASRAPYSALLYGRPKQRAIRVGDYKLILKADKQQSLFDISADPDQSKDLMEEAPIALRLCETAFGEAIANPARADRLSDRSERIEIRPEYIKE